MRQAWYKRIIHYALKEGFETFVISPLDRTKKLDVLSHPRTEHTGPKHVQAAYYQLKLGKGFFKQFSKAIGKDDRRECFGNCNPLQTPQHLVLHCKHYT
jgi:hypothetical protein